MDKAVSNEMTATSPPGDTSRLIEHGQQALQDQSYTEVVNVIDQLFTIPGAFDLAGQFYTSVTQALLDLDQKRKKNPLLAALLKSPPAISFIALWAASQGESQAGINWVSTLLEREPENETGLSTRAQLLFAMAGSLDQTKDGAYTQEYLLKAKVDYDSLVRLAPQNAAYLVQRAEVSAALSDDKAALSDYAAAMELDPTNTEPLASRARFYDLLGNIDLAIQDLTTLVQIDSENMWAHATLADLYQMRGNQASQEDARTADYQSALNEYSETIRISPNLAMAYYNRGRIYERLQENIKALADYSQAVQLEPKTIDFLLQRGQLYFNLKEYGLAEQDFLTMLQLDDKNTPALGNLADTYLAIGDSIADLEQAKPYYELALSGYEKISQADTTHTLAQLRRATTYRRLGEYESAVEIYTGLLADDPQNIESLNQRGLVYQYMGEYQKALDDYQELVKIAPDDPVVYRLRADALAGLGYDQESDGKKRSAHEYYRSALADYNKAIKLDARFSQAYTGRGKVYSWLEKGDKALKDYSSAIQINPDETEAYNARGLLYWGQANYEAALSDFENLVRLAPSDPVSYRLRGEIYLALQDYQPAIQDFNIATALNRDFPEPWLGRGRAYTELNKTTRALEEYNQYLMLVPDDSQALSERSDLYISIGYKYYTEGKIKRSKRYYRSALSDIEAMLKIVPDLADSERLRGDILVYLEQDKAGMDAYQNAIRLDPNLVAAYLGRANLRSLNNQNEAALADYEAALNIQPDISEAFLKMGDIHLQMDIPSQAIKDYDRALALQAQEPRAYLGRGRAYLNVGDGQIARHLYSSSLQSYLNAVQDLKKAIELGSADYFTYWYLGIALRAISSYEPTTQAYQKALELLDPSDSDSHVDLLYNIAETLRSWGESLGLPDRLEESVKYYDLAMQIKTDKGRQIANLGGKALSLLNLKRYDDAEQVFKQALEIDPADGWVHFNYGLLFYSQGQYETARSQFEHARELFGESQQDLAWAYVAIGLVLSHAGYQQDAQVEFQKTLQVFAEFSPSDQYLERASTFEYFKDELAYTCAEKDRIEALLLGGLWAESLNALAWMYVDKLPTPLNLQKAINLASKAVQAEGSGINQANYLDTLAWATYKAGTPTIAQEYIQKAAELAPNDTQIQLHLSTIKTAVQSIKVAR